MSKEFEEIVMLVLLMSLLFVVFAAAIIASIIRYKTKQNHYIKEKEQLQVQFAQTLLQTQLEIKEQTLNHIAYELHDNLGQAASLIKINLNTLKLDDEVKATQKIEETKDLVRQLIADLKAISVNLNSDRIAHFGIEESLANEVERLNKITQIEATMKMEGPPSHLPANTTIILFRMMQEILNNAVKHSEARRIVISIRNTEKLFILVCKDDGVGFDKEIKIKSGGSGLINLENRARLINATISFQSEHRKGTTITIELPL